MQTEELPIGLIIKQIGEKLAQQSNSLLNDCDLTMSQIHLLQMIARSEDGLLCMKHAERELQMAQSTVAGLAARLVAKGLIAYDVQEDDRRKKRLCITEAGWRVIDVGREKMMAVEHRLVERLTAEEQDQFRRMLCIVLESIQQDKETDL